MSETTEQEQGQERYFRSDNAERYRSNASFVYSDEFTAPVLRLLDAQEGDRILDLGCGSGELTLKLLPLVGARGKIVGVDAARDMLDKAQALARAQHAGGPHDDNEHKQQVQFELVDGHELEQWIDSTGQKGKFDRVFSSAALHWMNKAPQAVARGMRAALDKGGVLAVEFGGFANVAAVHRRLREQLAQRGINPDEHDPWYFPSAEEYTKVLEKAGFDVLSAEVIVRPSPLPKGLRGWLQTFGGPFLNALDSDAAREEVVAAIEQELRDAAAALKQGHQYESDDYAESWYDAERDAWTARYTRLRAKAVAR